MKKKPYTPTEAEAEAIERAGLTAAWDAMQPLLNDELPTPHKILACLRAFAAARSAVLDGYKRLKLDHPEASYVSHFTEETNMVCSALMGLDVTPDEIHPNSILGERVSALLQAAKALDAMSNVYAAFDDSDAVFGVFMADETAKFMEATLK